jgi:DNA-binding PadR family transcriptional regulator
MMPDKDEPRGHDPARSIGRNIEPFLLFDLLSAPSYGYELIRHLDERGFLRASSEPAVVYKVLRSLEDRGSIHSTWAARESGPARRYYEITEQGRAHLRRRALHLKRYLEHVSDLLTAYQRLTGDDLSADVGPGPDETATVTAAAQLEGMLPIGSAPALTGAR